MASAEIQPNTLIKQALALEYDEDPLYYEEAGKTYVVRLRDLENMVAMDLGDLPVECISVEESSPILVSRMEDDARIYEIGGRLTEFFPIYFVAALYELQSLLIKSDTQAYVIGGITRDLLLYEERRLEIQDVDITIEGDALAFVEFIAKNSKNFSLEEVFPEFGTAKVKYKEGLGFDIASTRKEVYPHCGALPQVVRRGVPLFEDISRRDFSTNALALSVNTPGRIIDYTNGIADIEAGLVRVLHPASFYEDPSRVLRAYKFAARFGFNFAPETERLLKMFFKHPLPEDTYRGGGDRIRYELGEFLITEDSTHKNRWLKHFMENHALRLVNMELGMQGSGEEDFKRLANAAQGLYLLGETIDAFRETGPLYRVYLCLLFQNFEGEMLEKTLHRLGLTRAEREVIEKYQRIRAEKRFYTLKEFAPPVDVYDLFNNLPLATVGAGIIDAGSDEPARLKTLLDAFNMYKRKWENVEIELDGDDLIDLGVAKGPAVGEMLRKLLHARLAGRVLDRMSEVRFVQQDLEESAEEMTDSV